MNKVACSPTDGACEKFKEKKHNRNKDNEKPTKYIPLIELPDSRLAEQGFDGKEIYFLVYDSKTGKTEKLKEIELDLLYRPIDNNEVRTQSVLLPN